MRTVVAIPMKDLERAKMRLAPFLSAAGRAHLVLTLFERALDFFRISLPDAQRVVVTASPTLSALARRKGAIVVGEDFDSGLNAAALTAFCWAGDNGFDRWVFVPGDISVWLAQELDAILLSAKTHDVAIARAHDGGTNALVFNMARVQEFEFCYGEGSCGAHERVCADRNLTFETSRLPFLGRDIDTVEDCLVLSSSLRLTEKNES